MPHAALSAAVARTLRAAAPPAEADGRLLARFVATRDGEAFAELVRRIGPFILAVCRRVTGDRHLADDAFQAAFLVLARRAADVRPRDAVRPFLYGVAVRVAREARIVSARRRARETPVPVVPDRVADSPDVPDADALRLLDEAVAALPDHLRAAVVLCELDGLGRKDAAARLGIPEGTLSSRLAKARKLLAERLRKRGLALPAAGLGVLAGPAVVSARLASAASALASPGAAVPTAVAALTTGVFRTMLLQKLTVAGLAAVALAACALAATPAPPAAPPRPLPVPLVLVPTAVTADDKKPEPAAKPAGPGTIALGREGVYWLLNPDGTKRGELPIPENTHSHANAGLSPDGTRVAYVVTEDEPPSIDRGGKPWPFKVVVRNLEKPHDEKVWDQPAEHGLRVRWAADGKKLVVAKHTGSNPPGFESDLLDPDTGKAEKLGPVRVLDCLKDGKTYLVEDYDEARKVRRLGLWSAADKRVRVLTELRGYAGGTEARVSPDGKTVLFTDADPERKDAYKWGKSHRPYLLDVKAKAREPLPEFPEDAQATGVAWSPDGKKLAYAWKQLHPESLKKDMLSADDAAIETEAFLVAADADGSNPKTVASDKGMYWTNMIFGTIDWR